MAVAEVMPVMDAGEWLVTHRWEMERGEAAWLFELGRFDAEGLWELDGQLSCVEWLMLRTKMGRATAFDKVRIARELRRRPVIAEAFAGADCRTRRCGPSPA